MTSYIFRAGLAVCVVASQVPAYVSAQTAAAPSAETIIAPIAAPSAANAVLRVGTEVPLKLSETLTTKGKMLRVGQRFHMEVASDIVVQGITVVPAGSPAMGEITDVRNKGMWGKSGHLSARILYVTVNGRQIRMSGAFDDKGVAGGIGAAAVSAVVFLPAGFFMTGTSAQVPLGAAVKGFIDEDVPLAIASAAMAPLPVAAPAAPAAVPASIPASAVVPK
ncbi:hypothetical protein [Sphingomonas sp. HMP6]|uniref:hypothetical protein n=1 Tax=Sphingomonas sp. HMP6 TaxID=1517551 RepID=UPI00159B4A75|nr:hypothetical protein [Sphingomonas sp. HMP6]BCA57944.1 hypothetical protein HMP06_0713 [Sphingomonas sp. HMP6]